MALAVGLEAQRERTVEQRELAVEGALPAWLSGSLLRNGPGDWCMGEDRMRHWFDGAAVLHHFSFASGRVRFSSRYLDTSARREAESAGRLASREFATDPCRSIFQRVHTLFDPQSTLTDNANVNVQRLGDRFLAMTETPMPVTFDPATLRNTGRAYEAPGPITTAHPHYDRATGAMLNYAVHVGPRSSYRFFRVDPKTAAVERIASVPVRRPAYMHSFSITERFFVLSEYPLVVNPVGLALSNKPFIANYRWKPERGTRFTVVDRGTGAIRARATTDAFFAFHHINAFEAGGRVVVDLCAADDASIIDDLYLDRIRARFADPSHRFTGYPHPTRFEIDLGHGQVTRRELLGQVLELPVVNHRRVRERPYRHVWGVGSDDIWLDRLIALDVETGEARVWREPEQYPGEPVFVERPDATAEDDGVLLSVVLDSARETSALMVLDARTLEVLARAEVGQALPFGLHGLHTRAAGDSASA